ncbi:MAG: phospholipase D-like domain-containing protein [Limisphaerales bacterium]
MNARSEETITWLRSGREALARMLPAINEARESVRLEVYIFDGGPATESFRDALIEACRRGARVQVLVDALGSLTLPDSFWKKLRDCGGECRWFNPLSIRHLSIRDHRKVLVCDGKVGFIGSFNMAAVYQGDGVTQGWRELGLEAHGPVAVELAASFDEMFARADWSLRGFFKRRKPVGTMGEARARLLLGGPSRANPIRRALLADLRTARRVRIVTPYFYPPWAVWRALLRVARQGGEVQLMLPGKTDVRLAQLAGRSYYRRLMRAGGEIYEYQPQILHAKMILIDGIVYVGSANLDKRSLSINYELMLRLTDPRMSREAHEIFEGDLAHCRRIDPEKWRRSRSVWSRFKTKFARLLLVWADSVIAEYQWRRAGLKWRGRRRSYLAKATK